MNINPTKSITRNEAWKLAPILVAYTEGTSNDFDAVNDAMNKSRKGQSVVLAQKNYKNPFKSKYFIVKVSSVKHDCLEAEDGPVIRVTDGIYSWRTDGCDFIFPVK